MLFNIEFGAVIETLFFDNVYLLGTNPVAAFPLYSTCISKFSFFICSTSTINVCTDCFSIVTFLAFDPCFATTSIGTEFTLESSFKEAVALKSSADNPLTTDLFPDMVIFTYLSDLTSYTISISLIASSCVISTGILYIITVFSGSVILITVSQIKTATTNATILMPTLCVNEALIFAIAFFIALPSFPKSFLRFYFHLSLSF